MNTEVAVQSITDKQVLEATESMKRIDTEWRRTLCDRISASDAWKEYSNNPCTLSVIDNMAAAKVKRSSHRLMFLEACAAVIDDYAKRKKRVEKS